MENQRKRAYLFWRYGPLSVSFMLYLLCLPLDAFCVEGSGWPGYGILLFGPLGMLLSSTNWTWVANPILLAAWIMLGVGARILSAVLSLAAFVIAISFMFQLEIMTNASGHLFAVTCYRFGYWLWLSSMAVCCLGSMATIKPLAGYENRQ